MTKAEEDVERRTSNIESRSRSVRETFEKFVIPSYARFDLVLERGKGSHVWDLDGSRYLDLAAGIAVCALGHAHPEVTKTLTEQSQKLIHVSNLYYTEHQGRLAKRIVDFVAPGRVFFCNSGAEANEGLFKFARKFGHDTGRYEIITTSESFHGRTLAGIAATGQEKVKKGFEPAVAGFKHVPFNDLKAMRDAITRSTIAILVEPVQGEGGITIAKPEYLIGLRQLCDEQNLLLLFDEVQAGHFRTGKFQSWQRILEVGAIDRNRHGSSVNRPYLPDAVSMAKALGGGFPMGAFWVGEKFANVLSAGTHASTFGGTPLACAVALKIFDVIERENLAENARELGEFLLGRSWRLQNRFPNVVKVVRGLGLMIGIEFQSQFKAADVVKELHKRKVLTVPAGNSVVRLLPALNLSREDADEGLQIIEKLVVDLSNQK
ncbi:MAG TPA: aspartate aminotransferase family protein [Chthoniobacterales bacterium]|nr:aspartate aminotransferase family protein [Chthoniobacterales bacterium]